MQQSAPILLFQFPPLVIFTFFLLRSTMALTYKWYWSCTESGNLGRTCGALLQSKSFESIALYWWMQAKGTFTAHAAFLAAHAPFCITTRISKAAICNFRDTALDLLLDSSFLYIKQTARNSLYVLGSSSTRYTIYGLFHHDNEASLVRIKSLLSNVSNTMAFFIRSLLKLPESLWLLCRLLQHIAQYIHQELEFNLYIG